MLYTRSKVGGKVHEGPSTEFRAEIRDWLRSRLEGDFAAVVGAGGPGREHEALDARIAWEEELGRGHWIGMAWPEESGGRDLPMREQMVFWEEYIAARGPGRWRVPWPRHRRPRHAAR